MHRAGNCNAAAQATPTWEALDSLDAAFMSHLTQVQRCLNKLPRASQIRAELWSSKLAAEAVNDVWRRTRNDYAVLLADCVSRGAMAPPFDRLPPTGDLPRLPAEATLRLRRNKQLVAQRARRTASPLDTPSPASRPRPRDGPWRSIMSGIGVGALESKAVVAPTAATFAAQHKTASESSAPVNRVPSAVAVSAPPAAYGINLMGTNASAPLELSDDDELPARGATPTWSPASPTRDDAATSNTNSPISLAEARASLVIALRTIDSVRREKELALARVDEERATKAATLQELRSMRSAMQALRRDAAAAGVAAAAAVGAKESESLELRRQLAEVLAAKNVATFARGSKAGAAAAAAVAATAAVRDYAAADGGQENLNECNGEDFSDASCPDASTAETDGFSARASALALSLALDDDDSNNGAIAWETVALGGVRDDIHGRAISLLRPRPQAGRQDDAELDIDASVSQLRALRANIARFFSKPKASSSSTTPPAPPPPRKTETIPKIASARDRGGARLARRPAVQALVEKRHQHRAPNDRGATKVRDEGNDDDDEWLRQRMQVPDVPETWATYEPLIIPPGFPRDGDGRPQIN